MEETYAARLIDVHKTHHGAGAPVHALRGVDLAIVEGSFVTLMGASGSGKSTLLSLLAGLSRPDRGTVIFGGRDLAPLSDDALSQYRRWNMGIVFQAYNLVPVLTACDNVALPLILRGSSRRDARLGALQALERVGLGDRSSHLPDALSGGEQQRVAIARALVGHAQTILADEPTGNLDSHSAAGIIDLLVDLHGEGGRTVLLVTHDAAIASRTERVVVLADGRIAGEIPPMDRLGAERLAQAYHAMVQRGTPA